MRIWIPFDRNLGKCIHVWINCAGIWVNLFKRVYFSEHPCSIIVLIIFHFRCVWDGRKSWWEKFGWCRRTNIAVKMLESRVRWWRHENERSKLHAHGVFHKKLTETRFFCFQPCFVIFFFPIFRKIEKKIDNNEECGITTAKILMLGSVYFLSTNHFFNIIPWDKQKRWK